MEGSKNITCRKTVGSSTNEKTRCLKRNTAGSGAMGLENKVPFLSFFEFLLHNSFILCRKKVHVGTEQWKFDKMTTVNHSEVVGLLFLMLSREGEPRLPRDVLRKGNRSACPQCLILTILVAYQEYDTEYQNLDRKCHKSVTISINTG